MQCHNANFDQVSNRFDRLWVKNEPIATIDRVAQEDIAVLHKHSSMGTHALYKIGSPTNAR